MKTPDRAIRYEVTVLTRRIKKLESELKLANARILALSPRPTYLLPFGGGALPCTTCSITAASTNVKVTQ